MTSRPLGQPNAQFIGDEGAPDPLVRAIVAGVRDQKSYIRALVALCTSRLLLPVVAEEHDVAAVTLTEGDTTHLLAFTGLDSLQQWRPEARPVPCLLDELCSSVEPAGATALLLDVAGPTPFVIAGQALRLLAEGFRVVEFEGEDFAWVKYADAAEEDGSSELSEGQGAPSEPAEGDLSTTNDSSIVDGSDRNAVFEVED